MVFPIEGFVGDSPVEEEVWAFAKRAIPHDSLSFHNYFLETKRPDIILLTPNRGVLIIEIKGFLAKNIKSVPDSTVIKFYNAPPKGSPFNQAIEYRNKLIEMMGRNPKLDPSLIAVAVCYPYITHEEFIDKKLYKVSMEEMTILKEDLINETAFNEKIERIYDFVYQSMGIKFGQIQFENEVVKQTAYLFAPEFDKDIKEEKKDIPRYTPVKVDYYSKLITFSEHVDKEILEQLINEWVHGGKLFLFFSSESDYEWFRSAVADRLAAEGITGYESFCEVSDSMPNLVFARVEGLTKCIQIENGEKLEQHDEVLSLIDERSLFNYQQYKVEHADTTDIIVRAGAGTGKTFSMLSRINYLIWKHQYNAAELEDKIAMITFTNDAAREMKDKLANFFFERFLLTKGVTYLEYMEAVENMNISTIHSLAKEIIKKNAAKIGLGTNFTISGSNYERNRRIHDALNEHITSSNRINTSIPLYQLENRIESFVSQIENKNIDIVNDHEIDFGKEDSINGRMRFIELLPVITKAKESYQRNCKDNNKMALSDILLQLSELANGLESSKGLIDYLFVDEFQDTDDVQIGLITRFKKAMGFKLFVVGDTKQCIYRFRGADDAAFDQLKKGIMSSVREIELKKNYRTDKLLLRRMNKTFSAWNKKGDIEYGDRDVLIGTKEYNNSDSYYKKTYVSEDDRNRMIIEDIQTIQKDFPNDRIAVLVRTNNQVLKFKEICNNANMRVETSVGGSLYKSAPALDLLKLLHALKYHQSPKDIYGLYTTSYVSEALDKIVIDSLPGRDKLNYFLKNTPKSLKKWNEYIKRLRLEPVLKVVRDLVDDAKPWSIFACKMGGTKEEQAANKKYYLVNLNQIFEKISLLSNTDYLTLNSLIEYLEIMILTKQEEDERESLISTTNTNIPLCTTVHKAKGLEYEHVILPFCLYDVASSKTKGDVDIIYINKKVGYSVKGEDNTDKPFANNYYYEFKKAELADRRREEVRILYVAMTRAKKSLSYYVDNTDSDKKATGNWKAMLEIGD